MHFSITATLLVLTPLSLAYSEHYARGYDDGRIEALLARREELLRRIDTKATFKQAVSKISASSKDGSAIMKVFNKTPQGRDMFPEKIAGGAGAFVGGIEGAVLPKKGSSPVTNNPGLNAQDKKNGKTQKEYEQVGAKASVQTTEHSIGNVGPGDRKIGEKIGTFQGKVASKAGNCFDGLCNFSNKHLGTKLRRDVDDDDLELFVRDFFEVNEDGIDLLTERDLIDDDADVWY